MPKFTRKHYQQFADTIRGCDTTLFTDDELDALALNLNEFKKRLGELFAPIFKVDNPRFKADLFIKRCSHEDPFFKPEGVNYAAVWGEIDAKGIASESLDDVCDLDSVMKAMESMSRQDKKTTIRFIKDRFYPDGMQLLYTNSPFIGFNLCRYYYREKKAAEIAVLIAAIEGKSPMYYGEPVPPHVNDHPNACVPYWEAVTG